MAKFKRRKNVGGRLLRKVRLQKKWAKYMVDQLRNRKNIVPIPRTF